MGSGLNDNKKKYHRKTREKSLDPRAPKCWVCHLMPMEKNSILCENCIAEKKSFFLPK